MGSHNSHLTKEDRILIHYLLYADFSISEIADAIQVNKTTIYRELYRNSSEAGYRP